ncbi:EF-hand domain-containing protein [Chelativorans alearense]|uniref:EF-hand domain-containing protein n=1 Tax=Chelativorans alearense TaxID=2681495 RepID=UPI0013CFD142|nr:EF-hand domain-containing protein [Chelativorans alearense]
MKKTIFAALSGLLIFAGTAAAQTEMPMHEGHLNELDANASGAVNQQEYQTFMTQAFGRLDANGDGYLVETETTQVLNADQFAATDANGDGRVSQDEFMNRVMQDFAAADRSGDGRLE